MCTAVLTLPVAVGADGLHLLDHPGRQLSDHDAHAAPPAGRTLLNGACFTSLPATNAQMQNIKTFEKGENVVQVDPGIHGNLISTAFMDADTH